MDRTIYRQPLVLSAALHALLVCAVLFYLSSSLSPKHLESVQKSITIQLVAPQKQQQIVSINQGQLTDKPVEDAFLGKENRIVEKQTVNSKVRRLDQSAQKTGLKHLGIPLLSQSTGGVGQKTKNTMDLDKFKDSFGGSVDTSEYVKGINEGEATALNTREFVFYSYFERIRKSLDLAWPRTLRTEIERLYRHGRSLASEKEHTTKILVTINVKGEIVRVQVIEESGTKDLDDAAVKAFNKAGPFPNPPKGLLNTEKQVHIRWDFILKT